ncbi:MAG: septum formation initiator family protein [Chitinophagia bacterium]|jgi:cell division protein FtsB|nr:septum formation initiator family protein [Chitinophagia bacterium]NCA29231.1 septum formation initiator family protein [Chitinophagia bacterium]NDD16409.1 septum formation initiator family protein [Chitinophagia bacterium]
MLILHQVFTMQFIKKIIPYVANRYFIVSFGFVVWMLFFDQRDFFQQRERAAELKKVEDAKKYYQKEIESTQKQLDNIQNNKAAIEKYARERYLLRREGEELYLFEDTLHTSNK